MSKQRIGIVLLWLGGIWLGGKGFSQNIVLFDAPGMVITNPVAINAAGTIAGNCALTQLGPHQGFIRDAGGTITLINPPGSVDTYVTGINWAETIAGRYKDGAGNTHGFLRDASGNFTVLDVPGSPYTDVDAINGLGDVTGNYRNASNTRTFIYIRHADGSFTSVEGLLTFGIPRSINVKGTIAGDGVFEQGFVREPEGTTTLFAVPISYIQVAGMNAGGAISGTSYNLLGNDYHPFVRDPSGNITTFLTERSCGANSINEAGEITGGCFAGDAFVRDPGGAIHTFGAPAGSDCLSLTGTGINSPGVVTGTCGTASGAIHGFVRMP
jgi:hypothetical protein